MNNVVTIKATTRRGCEAVLHPDKAAAIGIWSRKFAWIHFGNRQQYIQLQLDPDFLPDNLGLSRNLICELALPDYPRYEVAINQNKVVVGPFIGLLVCREAKRLTLGRLKKIAVYLSQYPQLHGAVVVFALEKVNRENRQIEGYCFNPANQSWQRGIFPYPAAIYRAIGLNPEWKHHFFETIGDKVFNSRFFNKWEMCQWFAEEPGIGPHLPHTIRYHSAQDALNMLEQHSKIYIKPILGLQGRGILRLSKEQHRLNLKFREGTANRTVVFDHPDQAGDYLGKRCRSGRYLIQQGIDLLAYKGGLIDFRCIVQKNQANDWICPAIIGRVGVRDSIVTNISSGGVAFTMENILQKAIPASEESIADLRRKLETLAIDVGTKLDEYGINCGNLGLDIGLDIQGRLWLIEINNRDPDPGIALDLHDRQLYYKLKAGPLFYAKYLAGFPITNAGDD
jgi:hypothetical protein